MIFSHIVAVSENNIIGVDGKLPWHLPEDLKFFKEKTLNSCIIMGRKTFESLPFVLPKRLSIIITRNKEFKAEGTIICHSLADAMKIAEEHTKQYGEEAFIIGGGQLYKESLPLVERVYLTRVHKKIDGDTTYPEIKNTEFSLLTEKYHDGETPFSILSYNKIHT